MADYSPVFRFLATPPPDLAGSEPLRARQAAWARRRAPIVWLHATAALAAPLTALLAARRSGWADPLSAVAVASLVHALAVVPLHALLAGWRSAAELRAGLGSRLDELRLAPGIPEPERLSWARASTLPTWRAFLLSATAALAPLALLALGAGAAGVVAPELVTEDDYHVWFHVVIAIMMGLELLLAWLLAVGFAALALRVALFAGGAFSWRLTPYVIHDDLRGDVRDEALRLSGSPGAA